MNNIFANNLRRLRQTKGYTQEQVADHLGVSPQSVSRWERGNTLPDVLQLPQIARLYHTTVDDLYRENTKGYPSYAQRLLAVYEASGRTEDFLAAEQEFIRISAGEHTADDLRSFGVLYHYMTKHCAALAQKYLDAAIAGADRSDQVWYSAAQQKTALLCDLGRGSEEAARYDRELELDPSNYQSWLLCATAHYFAKEYDRALEVALEGIGRFPGKAALHIYAGDSCRALKRYDHAFSHWQQALELDQTYLDAVYSMGFCHEELGQYDEALKVWTDLAQELARRGLVIERKYPAALADACRDRLSGRANSATP